MNNEQINENVFTCKTKLSSKYVKCSNKKSTFIKDLNNLRKTNELLSSLTIKTPLSKIHYWVIFCFH